MTMLTRCIIETKWRKEAFKHSYQVSAHRPRWLLIIIKRKEIERLLVHIRILICRRSIRWMLEHCNKECSPPKMKLWVICNRVSNLCRVLGLKLRITILLIKKLGTRNKELSTKRLASSTLRMRLRSYGRSRIWAKPQKLPSRSLANKPCLRS